MGCDSLFSVADKSVAITGGAGVLCGAMAKGLAARGAKVAVLDFDAERSQALCDEITSAGGTAVCFKTDVLDTDQVTKAFDFCSETFGGVDVLINGAGGNKKQATCVPPESLFRLVRYIDRPEVDTIFLSCTNLATVQMIADIEEETGKPVITSNQATFWRALRMAGVPDKIEGFGRLLQEY